MPIALERRSSIAPAAHLSPARLSPSTDRLLQSGARLAVPHRHHRPVRPGPAYRRHPRAARQDVRHRQPGRPHRRHPQQHRHRCPAWRPDRAAEIRDVIREQIRVGLRMSDDADAAPTLGAARAAAPAVSCSPGSAERPRQVAGGYAGDRLSRRDRAAGASRLIARRRSVVGPRSVGLFLYWRRFEYRVGSDEIRIDSGFLSRTHRSIPFDRVQDVDIEQGPVAAAARPRPGQARDRRRRPAPRRRTASSHAISLDARRGAARP